MQTLIRTACAGTMAALLAAASLASAVVHAAQPEDSPLSTEERQRRLEAARERLEEAAREVAELSLDDNGRRGLFQFRTIDANRAALGINIANRNERRDGAADEGVPVISVSPAGPAEKAGIKAGDVLLSLDGKPLRREEGRSPQAVLLAHMQGVEPGQTVAVEYRRDGATAKVNIVAQRLEPDVVAGVAGTRVMPMLERMLPLEGGMPRAFTLFRGSSFFGSIELVSLTPKLGQYFGTDKGLLVVRAPADSRLGLEEGDVILDIAGRVPESPAHAMRILDSYQPGEKLVLNVLRQKKRLPLSIEVPAEERRGGMMQWQFDPSQGLPASPVPLPGGDVIFRSEPPLTTPAAPPRALPPGDERA